MDRGRGTNCVRIVPPVENLESEHRANGVGVVVALTVAVHTERTTRTGVEPPRAVIGGLRRRPNVLITTGYIS